MSPNPTSVVDFAQHLYKWGDILDHMSPELNLLVHNIVTIISAVVSAALLVFVLAHNPRRTVNILLALTFFSVLIFYVSHFIGVNSSDPLFSRNVLMSNVCIIFITVFLCHAIIKIIGNEKERRGILIAVYAAGAALAAFYLIFPDTFLLPSESKMYFPSYYTPGQFHWIMRLFFNNLIPFYFFIELIVAYRKSSDFMTKNRFKYVITASILGYVTAYIPLFLIYDVPVNPTFGMLFILFYGIPFTYGVVYYDLLDIRIVAKKAFMYGLAVAGVGALIISVNALDRWLRMSYPDFPFWMSPLLSALLVVVLSILVWRKLREDDVLKYEFITTATHKFRTPLTHIKWATENLVKADTPEERQTQIGYIQGANAKLVELTNVLMNVSESDGGTFGYRLQKTDLSSLVEDVCSGHLEQADMKKISMAKNLQPHLEGSCDSGRIGFIAQTLIENAINYTPEGGTVVITTQRRGDEAVCSVRDSGIGISKDEFPLLFSKFYRGKRARLADTEGMGVGLFISKDIIARHHGKIWVESDGQEKGSVFNFSLPLMK